MEINNITIPAEYVAVCSNWAAGTDCMLRAISSTGSLTTGTIRPKNDSDYPMTDEEWYISLFDSLDCDVSRIVHSIEKQNRQAEIEGFNTLVDFQQWAEKTADELRTKYYREICLDYTNNFVTVAAWAEYYHMTEENGQDILGEYHSTNFLT